MRVSTNKTVDSRSGTFRGDIWKASVQFRAVSREIYRVGAEIRMPNTVMGTMEAGVPSLHSVRMHTTTKKWARTRQVELRRARWRARSRKLGR